MFETIIFCESFFLTLRIVQSKDHERLEFVDSGLKGLSKMNIVLYIRCYRSDPAKKVPDPAGQKPPDPDHQHCMSQNQG